MLEAIRRYSNSWYVKALFGLLILSFGVWGIGDVITGRHAEDSVATVGSVKISPQYLTAEYQRELRRMQVQTGGRLTAEQANAFGLNVQVLHRIIGNTLLDLAAENLGLAVSDTVVRQHIENSKAFKNTFGKFDRNVFRQLLNQNGLSESQYVSLLRQDIAHNQIIRSLDAGLSAPASVVDALFKYHYEKRIADTVLIADAAMPDPGAPTDAELTKFHEDHKDLFTAPEYRAITVVSLQADDLAKHINVSDKELRDAFDQSGGGQVIPEKRTFQQILVKSQKDAEAAYQRIQKGEKFAAVAKDVMGDDVADLEHKDVTRDELVPDLAKAVFGATKDVANPPVKTEFGWAILRVTNIDPGRQLTFEQSRAALTKSVAHEKAIDELYKLANKLQDALAGGASLEAAAKTVGAREFKIDAVDASGKDPSGAPVKSVLPGQKFLQTVFSTAQGQQSALTEQGTDGYFIVRVDKITPSALRPLSEVRDQVIKDWKAERRSHDAEAKAVAMVSRLNGGAKLSAEAGQNGLKVTETPALNRYGQGAPADVSSELISNLFDIKPGKAVQARSNGGYIVAVLKSVVPANPAAEPGALDNMRKEVLTSMRNDIQGELQAGLEQRHPVSINEKAFKQLF